jgi:hypothetical protein
MERNMQHDNYFDSPEHDRDLDEAYAKSIEKDGPPQEKVCIWPDGDWCYEEDYEEFGINKSDDYITRPLVFVSVYKPVAGWKAVVYSWTPDLEMFEPEQTAYFAFATREEAVEDAKVWAECEEIPYYDDGGK